MYIFIMFKSVPGLDLRRFVYPHTFSTNGTAIRLILSKCTPMIDTVKI